MSLVDLGFAEECSPWQVTSRLFPSKIGGKPAWLDLENVPKSEQLQCETCKQQMIFLCQVYAPFEEDSNNFHRSLFIFVCRNSTCCKKNTNTNLKVFRSCLPRENKFYSYDPPKNEPDLNFSLSKWLQLCQFCGCVGEKHCSKCKSTVYCCRDHQVMHWKEHKATCGQHSNHEQSSGLFPEYEIVMEPEDTDTHVVDENKEFEKFERLKQEGNAGTLSDISEEELQAHAAVEDKVFTQFRKQISYASDQVLRYHRGGNVLWIGQDPKVDSVPNCEYCNGIRQFEFQIMPQMLSVLHEHDIDWGILVVFTCVNSCASGPNYKNEFIYKQDIVSDNN